MDRNSAINCLCRILYPGSDLAEITGRLSPADWQELVRLAGGQGAALLLYDRLKRIKDGVPEEIREKLRKGYLEATARNMLMLHHAGIILKALSARDIKVIPLKGLYLAEKVYPAVGLRTFDDLDLLVHKEDLASALQVMQGLSYKLSTWYDPQDANTDIKHIPPLLKEDAPIVELHWRLLEEEAPFTIDMDAIWQRAVNARIAGTAVMALSLEDLLMHLCLHFTWQHRLAGGLRGLYDIAEIIWQNGSKIDWQRVVRIAMDWRAERVLWLTLRLLQEILQVEVPLEVLHTVQPGDPARGIVGEAKRQLFEQGSSEMVITPDLAALADAQGLGGKLRVMSRRVFIPRRVLAREYNVDPRSPWIWWYYVRRFSYLIRHYRKQTWKVISRVDEANTAVDQQLSTAALNRWLAGND